MIDPASITVATIVGYAAPKLLEAALGKVGESLTEGAITQVKQRAERLRQVILRRAKPEQQVAVSQALEAAELPEQRQKLEGWLEKGMAANPDFAKELRQLAQEIDQVIYPEERARNLQQNIGAPGIQVNDSTGAVSQTNNYYSKG